LTVGVSLRIYVYHIPLFEPSFAESFCDGLAHFMATADYYGCFSKIAHFIINNGLLKQN